MQILFELKINYESEMLIYENRDTNISISFTIDYNLINISSFGEKFTVYYLNIFFSFATIGQRTSIYHKKEMMSRTYLIIYLLVLIMIVKTQSKRLILLIFIGFQSRVFF